MNKFSVERNHCDCHPETCCCNPWKVVEEKGEKVCSFYNKGKAISHSKLLNELEEFKAKQLEHEREVMGL